MLILQGRGAQDLNGFGSFSAGDDYSAISAGRYFGLSQKNETKQGKVR
jgi:hypothetical protein